MKNVMSQITGCLTLVIYLTDYSGYDKKKSKRCFICHSWEQSTWRRHQAITWTNLDQSSLGFCGIQLRTISQEMVKVHIIDTGLKMTNVRSQPDLLGADELTHLPYVVYKHMYMVIMAVMISKWNIWNHFLKSKVQWLEMSERDVGTYRKYIIVYNSRYLCTVVVWWHWISR